MSLYLQIEESRVKITNYNDDFLLINAEEEWILPRLAKAIYEKQFKFIEEVIGTEVEICLKLNKHFRSYKIAELNQVQLKEVDASTTFKLPVYFDQDEDWEIVEKFSGIKKSDFIDKLSQSKLEISMFGFLPGFLYIRGLSAELQIPRKSVPSKYVTKNAVAIGGKYLGIYGLDSPGGWNIIGYTPLKLLDLTKIPPLQLSVNDQIVIEPIDQKKFDFIHEKKDTILSYNA